MWMPPMGETRRRVRGGIGAGSVRRILWGSSEASLGADLRVVVEDSDPCTSDAIGITGGDVCFDVIHLMCTISILCKVQMAEFIER